MTDFETLVFGAADVLPRGACLGWHPGLVALHAASAGVISVTFLLMPLAIWVFLRGRPDFDPAARFAAKLFCAVLLAAAVSRVIEVVSIWSPIYGLQGFVKALIAVVSAAAAIGLWRQIPKLWRLPSPRDLQVANDALANANLTLEDAIARRTHELEQLRQRFEMAMQRSNMTAFSQDRNLRYTWVYNPRRGLTPEQMLGRTTEEVLPDEAASDATELKHRALEGETANDMVAVRTADEGTVYLDMTASPTVDANGAIDGILCTAMDVSEKQLFQARLAGMAAQLANAYRRFELALENSPVTVFEQDAELRYTDVHNPPDGTTPEDYIGRTDAEILSEADARKLGTAKDRVFANGERERLEVDMRIGGASKFYDVTLEPKLTADGRVVGIVGTALDLSERRQNERQMRLVMRELTHRSKNLLAVIQSMARKTASLSDDLEGFIVGFSSRLRAMAAAQDLLVSHSWSEVDLGELIRASLAQTIDPTSPQVRIDGPPLKLPPDLTQSLGLAFHELTTNAAKYGALSVDSGHLDIVWRTDAGEVTILWRETGGPKVVEPKHRGFGRVLLERVVKATLGGTVTLSFPEEGLTCEIAFPTETLGGAPAGG